MKAEARVIGVDDAAFTWADATVPVVGVIARGARYVDGVFRTDVTVDGEDATDKVLDALTGSRVLETTRAVFLDGVTLGGFNVVDVPRLAAEAGVAVVTVTKGVPDMDAVERALRKHHADADRRLALMNAVPRAFIRTQGQGITLGYAGIPEADAIALVSRFTVRGLTPEPLRLAHLVARGVFGGEFRGR